MGAYAEDDVNKKRLRKENGVLPFDQYNIIQYRNQTLMKQWRQLSDTSFKEDMKKLTVWSTTR